MSKKTNMDNYNETVYKLLNKDKLDEEQLKKNLLPNLKKLTRKQFDSLIESFSQEYYNGEEVPSISDLLFDFIEEYYSTKFKLLQKKVGAIIRSTAAIKTTLPYPMFSLDKIKEENTLNNWKNKFSNSNFYSDDKLDGVSACYQIKDGVRFLYKRGDHNEGTDISYLLDYLNIPTIDENEFAVRGELVISLRAFEKYKDKMKNPRNMVSGLTNSKTFDPEVIKDIDFVAYQIYTKSNLSKEQQIKLLIELNFNIPEGSVIEKEDLTLDCLTILTKYRKRKSKYDIDGLVLTVNEKNCTFPKDANPKHQVAFKIQGDTSITNVINVEWNISKQGLYKPRVSINPVNLSGVTVSWVTAHNARFIVDNGIGPGAKILITRSGEVIPKILDVIEKVHPQLPEDKNAIWNENKVELMINIECEKEGNIEIKDEVTIKKIVSFFSELGAKYLAETTIRKIYNSGIKSLKEFLNLEQKDIIKIEGFKEKSSERIVSSIQGCIKNIPLHNVMAASCFFSNFGSKRLKLITDEIKNLQNITEETELEVIKGKILNISGFKTLADIFIQKLPEFNKWLSKHKEITICDIKQEVISVNNSLIGETIVFSGVRNSILQKEIERCGGRVTTAVSKQTTIVIIKDSNFSSSKIQKAKDNGARILEIDEFADEYCLKLE